MEKLSEEQYRVAKALKKIDRIKSYYMHVAAYVLMNAFILIAWAVDATLPETFYTTSISIIAIWGGLGLLVHTVIHFADISLMGKKWEERTLKKILNKDTNRNANSTNQL